MLPVAQRLAEHRGMSVVLGARAQALSWNASVDITDAVLAEVAELKKSGAFMITSPAPESP